MVRWGAAICLAAGLILCIRLFEPIRPWTGHWSTALFSNVTNNFVGTKRSHDTTGSESNASKSKRKSFETESTSHATFGNTVGIFDDFHAIDRELSRLNQETHGMLRAIAPSNAKLRDVAIPIDRLDPEVTRLKQDTKRLESEFSP